MLNLSEEKKYRFYPNVPQKTLKRIKFIDKVLGYFSSGKNKEFNANAIREITITQFAHIGDMILMLPAIKTLKSVTNYKINLLVSSQNNSIAKKLTFVDSVTVIDAPYFSRGKKVSYFTFISQLRKVTADLIYDVRGDLRNNLFIKLFVRKKLFAGYDVGGGGAMLDAVLPFTHGGHVSNLFDPLFSYLNLPPVNYADYWSEDDMPFDEIAGENFPANFLIVHLGTGAQARKWSVENFINTIKSISNEIPVYVMGVAQDLTEEQQSILSSIPNVVNCIGKYSILQSIYLVKKCTLYLGLDSGFSHIAAMLKKKIVILFSGTVNKDVWKPVSFYKDQVILLNQKVICDWETGCGKLECDDNICMKQITPARVVDTLRKNLPVYDQLSLL